MTPPSPPNPLNPTNLLGPPDPDDPTEERYYPDALRAVLRTTAEDLERLAADWAATAASDNPHTPPLVIARTAATARAHTHAARLVRAVLARLEAPDAPDAPPEEERPYPRSELLYAVTRGDAEGYLQDRLGDDEAPTDALVDAFAAALKHTIDADAGWGEQLRVCCEVTYAEFARANGLLETDEDEAPGGA